MDIPTKAKGSPRKTMGTIAATGFENASAAPSKNTKLMPKKHGKAADPVIKDAANRSHVKARSGARYGIRVGFEKQTSPEAGMTQGQRKNYSCCY